MTCNPNRRKILLYERGNLLTKKYLGAEFGGKFFIPKGGETRDSEAVLMYYSLGADGTIVILKGVEKVGSLFIISSCYGL